MRLGIGDPTVLDALSFARKGDRSLRPVLEAAYNRTSDLGLIARTLWESGETGLDALKVRAGHPLRPQLAERLPNPEAVIKKLGTVGVQPKYDGLRVQIHKDADEVSIFSRNLDSMTEAFPELVAAASKLKAKSVILDGEAIAYNPESEEYVPFQETTARRRKEGIEEFAEQAPLRAFVFDVMFRDGSDLTQLPYQRRFEIAQELLKKSDTLLTAPLTKTDSAEELTRELLDNISRGLEGVVAKRLDSPYQAGARNFNWVKLKRNTSGQLNDTIDVVLLGYYRGKGKRAEFGAGALLAGVYDADKDEFVTISKLGTGLSDQGWREMHQRLTSLEVPEKPARVNSLFVPDAWLKPEIVVEVLADEITPSPRHTAGMTADRPGFALRFPRIVSLRTADKKPEDATSVHEIREMFEQQRRR
jgi:DNA ligase-1